MGTNEYGSRTSSFFGPLFVNVGNDPGESIGSAVVDIIESLPIIRGDYYGVVGYLKAGKELVEKFGGSGRWMF